MRLTTARRLRIRNNILWTIAAALAFISCSRHTVYSHYEPVSMDGWERSDTLYYTVATPLDSGLFSSYVNIRVAETYPYQELTLIVEQQLLHADSITADTLNITLADPEGHFGGEGLSLLDYTTPLGTIMLNKTDTMKVTIRHNMRRELLPGISGIGFTLEE